MISFKKKKAYDIVRLTALIPGTMIHSVPNGKSSKTACLTYTLYLTSIAHTMHLLQPTTICKTDRLSTSSFQKSFQFKTGFTSIILESRGVKSSTSFQSGVPASSAIVEGPTAAAYISLLLPIPQIISALHDSNLNVSEFAGSV